MKKLNLLIRVFFLYILLPNNAWAYIDPGTGMLLWQGVIAAVGAALIFIKNPIKSLKSWIARIRKK